MPTEFDIEAIFERALDKQQSAFDSRIQQLHAMEARIIKHVSGFYDDAKPVTDLLEKMTAFELRIKKLEDDRLKALGLQEAFRWIPQAVVYAIIVLGALFIFFQKVPPHV